MFQRFGFTHAREWLALRFAYQLVDSPPCACPASANTNNLPKPRRQKRVSLDDIPLNSLSDTQLCGGGNKALGVGRRTQQISGFLECLIVFQREHYYGLLAVARDD